MIEINETIDDDQIAFWITIVQEKMPYAQALSVGMPMGPFVRRVSSRARSGMSKSTRKFQL